MKKDLEQQLNELSLPEGMSEIHRQQLRRQLLQSPRFNSKPSSFMSKLFIPVSAVLGVAAVAVIGVAVYVNLSHQPVQVAGTNLNTNTQLKNTLVNQAEQVVAPEIALAKPFATYQEPTVKIDPQVPGYTVGSNLSNVVNAAEADFAGLQDNTALTNLLVKNGFAVTPGYDSEFFSLYEQNRYSNTASFITTDALLHNYHLVFDDMLKHVEETELMDQLRTLNAEMLASSIQQEQTLAGTDWELPAQRNVAFYAVGSVLLDPTVSIPANVQDTVNAELALMEAHAGLANSPTMAVAGSEYMEDYSQYVPRGHYDKTEDLKKYFKSMMWYGRMTFRTKYEGEMQSAILSTLALEQDEHVQPWGNIYDATNFFVGKSDDISYREISQIVHSVYGNSVGLNQLVSDQAAFTTFMQQAKLLEPPQINSLVIPSASIEPDRDAAIKGFRFMGQRYTLDANIFQNLICRAVGNKHGTVDCPTDDSRMLPKGLDIPAALGSDEALSILTNLGETEYKNYPENMQALREKVAGLDQTTWSQNLYWGWLFNLRPLTGGQRGAGYPTFMQNQAWSDKELNTYLGSWTELKHDTILYAKQVYAELGGGPADPADDRGYVEPNPEVFARLTALLQMTSQGLEIRGLLDDSTKENLTNMQDLTSSLQGIAEKELANQPLSDDDYELIRSFGGQLEHFWLQVNKDELGDTPVEAYLAENPAAIVADVATDPNGSVLEEGTGAINNIYVVVPIDGKLHLTKGGVYSYYEFTEPLANRLTDKAWRELLQDPSTTPAVPAWTNSFLTH